MGMTPYMGIFFMMVVLGLTMIVATIILTVAYMAKKSDKRKPLRLNKLGFATFASLWVVFFGMFAIVGAVEPVIEPDKEEVTQVAAPQIQKTSVTLKELDSLKAGMNLKEVTEVIGEDGQFLYESHDHIGGIVSYRWENLPRGYAIVNFEKNQNGKIYFFNYYTSQIEE